MGGYVAKTSPWHGVEVDGLHNVEAEIVQVDGFISVDDLSLHVARHPQARERLLHPLTCESLLS